MRGDKRRVRKREALLDQSSEVDIVAMAAAVAQHPEMRVGDRFI
jgi:hypothetical protein